MAIPFRSEKGEAKHRELTRTYWERHKFTYDYYKYLNHCITTRPSEISVVAMAEAMLVSVPLYYHCRNGALKLTVEQALNIIDLLQINKCAWAWHSKYIYDLFDDWTEDERNVILRQAWWNIEGGRDIEYSYEKKMYVGVMERPFN